MDNFADVSILYHRKDILWVEWIEYQLKSRGLIVYKNDFSKGKIKNVAAWLFERSSDVTASILLESDEMHAGNIQEEWRHALSFYGNRQVATYRRKGLSAPPLKSKLSSSFIGDSEHAAFDAINEFCGRMQFRTNINRDKIISENQNLAPLYPGLIPRNWKMPYNELPVFYGRNNELIEIEKKMTKFHSINVRTKVNGRGFGLTSAMVKIVYSNINKYSTIWWIAAFDDSQLQDGLKELGQRYGLQGLSGGFSEIFPKILQAMQGKSKLPFLIILERPNQNVVRDLEKVVEKPWKGGVLVSLDAVQKKEVMEEVALDMVNHEDVKEIIISGVGTGNIALLEEVAGFLKYHPLLVTIATGLIKNGRKPESFIDDFKLEGELVKIDKPYLKPFAILSRFVIDQLSFANPDVEQLLNFSSYFAPLPLPSCIFEKPDDFEIDDDLFNRIIYDPRRLSVGLNKLSEYGMINISGGSLVMHPLISEAVTSMPEYRKNWPDRITKMLADRLSPDLPSDLLEERRSQIYPHMVDICTNIIRGGNVTEEVSVLINSIANQAKSLQNWELATELLMGLRNYFIKAHGERNFNVANISSSLGVIYKLQNKIVEAKEMFEKALQIDRDLYGENNLDVSDDYCHLARVYELENKFYEAVDLFKKGADILRAKLGEDAPKYAKVLCELIGVMKKNGQTADIYDYAKTVVRIEKKVYGEDSPKIVHSMVNIGFAAIEHQKYDEALTNFNLGMEIEGKIYGHNHVRAGKMLVLIGNVYERMGDNKQAKEKYNLALPIFKSTLGNDHPSLTTIKDCIARVS